MAKSKKAYKYRIVEVKKLNHFENDPDELNVSQARLKQPVQFDITTTMEINPDKELIGIKANAVFYINDNNERKELFGLTCAYKFQILDFVKNFVKNKEVLIPSDILTLCLSFQISGMRGMFAALNTRPEYTQIILPPLDPSEIVQQQLSSFKKKSD